MVILSRQKLYEEQFQYTELKIKGETVVTTMADNFI